MHKQLQHKTELALVFLLMLQVQLEGVAVQALVELVVMAVRVVVAVVVLVVALFLVEQEIRHRLHHLKVLMAVLL
jgi:hypothetical protein